MWTRDVGLKFDQEIKLTFEYKLMSYAGINPRVAFLDIMANLLVLTYSNANFWGGANRFYGGGGYVAKEFGDLQELAKGNYKNYLVSVVQEMGGGFSAVFGDIKTGAFDWSIPGILQGLQTLGGQLMGSFMGNFINKQIGALPAYQATQAFISGEPTGDWHLTIGNPINPIMMIGNLILEDSQLTFGGGLGWDDFPLELKLVVTLKHAKPRDKSDFESAFNAGKGRLYAGMSAIGDVLNLEGKDVATYGSLSKIDTGLNRITFDKVGNDDMRKHKISVDDAIDVGKIATSKEAYAAIEKRFSGWIKNKKGAATDFITMSMARIGR
jgi:hypothetical protein